MAATYITPVEVTPDDADQWDDVDLSAHIPVGATGVILHIKNNAYSVYAAGWRKNGSSDDRTQTIYQKAHLWVAIGVDGSRIVELYIDNITSIDVWLVGYFTDDEVFFTNAPDKSLSEIADWYDIDISGDTGGDTAIGAFFEIVGTTNGYYFGLRKNGSSDDRYEDVGYHSAGVIGVDGSEVCEGTIENVVVDFFLNGYVKANTTFLLNATNLSLGTTGEWLDLDALPVGATGGYIEALGTSAAHWGGLRENGSAEDMVGCFGNRHGWGMVECDGSRLIEGYINNISIDFFLTGYTETGEAPPTQKNVSDSGLGADSLADLKAFLSISETGSGIEALLGLYEKLVPDTGLAVDDVLVIGEALEKLVSDSGSGIESILGLYQKLVSDIGSGIESIFGPPIPPFYKELFIKRVSYRISSQGIKCDLELGELYLPLEQEILNILRDLKNEKELLQANTKQLSV